MGWCEELGLKILLDLHGTPGSQNGFDNSGRRGDVNWNGHSNIERTLTILDKMAQMLKSWILDGTMSTSTLYGIELVNEPYGTYEDVWITCRDDFFIRGYEVIRETFPDPNEVRVSIQQAFRNSSDFYGYMPESEGFFGVSLDMHIYHGFGYFWNHITEPHPNAWQTHLDGACAYIDEVSQQTLDTFTGEFSLALTNCQKYVEDGYANPYIPPFIEDPESVCGFYNSNWSTYTDEYKDFLKAFMLAQLDGAETGKIFVTNVTFEPSMLFLANMQSQPFIV